MPKVNKEAAQLLAYYQRDFEEFCRDILVIQDKDKRLVPFKFKPFQKVLWNYLLEDLTSGKPIRWMILKARQMGVSTWLEACLYWLASLYSNANAIILSHKDESAQALLGKLRIFHRNSPLHFRPEAGKDNRKELRFDGLESTIRCNVADDPDLGRSFTYQYAHLSEFAFYKEPATLIQGLFSSIPEKPGTAVFIESTANGEGTFKDMWDDTENGYRKVFFSFVAEPDYRIEVDEAFQLSTDPISRYGDEYAVSDLIRDELAVWSPQVDVEREVVCRLAWRRWYIDKKCFGDKKRFQVEHPLTAREAFMSTGEGIFPAEILTPLREYIELSGYRPQTFDLSMGGYAGQTYKPEATFVPSETGRLLVHKHWSEISKHERFVIGVDASYGFNTAENTSKTADKASVSVLRVAADSLEEIALWNYSISPYILADISAALGHLYNDALVAVEFGSAGTATLERLERDLNYRNLYFRERWDAPTKTYQQVFGWATSEQSKAIMLTKCEAAIREDRLRLHFIPTISELLNYKKFERIDKETGRKKYEFGGGSKAQDNIVMALSIAVAAAESISLPRQNELKQKEAQYGSAAFFEKNLREKQSREKRNYGGFGFR